MNTEVKSLDAKSIHEFIDSLYPDPIFTEWKPSEYDMKYKFKPTPRGQLKLAKQKEKEDAKLKLIFDREVETKAKVHKIIDEISTYPSEIASLFFNTFMWKIDYLKRCHENFLSFKKELKKYGNYVADHAVINLRYEMTETSYEYSYSGRRIAHTTLKPLSKEKWERFVKESKGEFIKIGEDKWDYEYPLKSIENPDALMDLVIKYCEAYDRDDLALKGNNAYKDAIIHMATVLEGILFDINRYFEGNKPTQCLTDATWGHKGEFCGILTDGTTKISFKSFGAGGWNIQQYHFRFKATKLKN